MNKKKYISIAVIAAIIIIGGLVLAYISQKNKQAEVAVPIAEVTGVSTDGTEQSLAINPTVKALPSTVLNSKISFSYPENWGLCSSGTLSVLAEKYEGDCPPVVTANDEASFNFPATYKGIVYTLKTLDLAKNNAAGCSTANECIAKVQTFSDITGFTQQTYNGRPAICFNFAGANGGGTIWQLFFTDTDSVSFIQYSGHTACSSNKQIDAILKSVKIVK